MDKNLQAISKVLFESKCIKFGDFRLKSGMKSPFYIDLRLLVSYPKSMQLVAKVLSKQAKKIKFDRIFGLPYAGIPIATVLSLEMKKPMIYMRKEKKEYGMKNDIEGLFESGERILMIDDLATTGESKLDFISPLTQNGLVVKDILVLVDREQGAKEFLREKGFNLHSVISITQVIDYLNKKNLVEKKLLEEALEFIKNNKLKS